MMNPYGSSTVLSDQQLNGPMSDQFPFQYDLLQTNESALIV